MKKICLLLLLLAATLTVGASHIAGAELSYICNGGNSYEFTLKFYRDCLNANPNATFDDPITLFIFKHNSGILLLTKDIPKPSQTPQLIPANWNACTGVPYNLCTQEGIYKTTINGLTPILGGYDVAWARCCRNNVVTNLLNPQCEGVTFLAHIPGSDLVSTCNSMPEFNQSPSLFLCAGEVYNFDNSATDPDGDSLVYKISNPYTGLNTAGLGAANPSGSPCAVLPNGPVVDILNPMGMPPYQNVVFSPGISFTNPFGIGSIFIDPNTGYLTAQPMSPGIYVVAISVLEYRNGKLLSENKRDFQFHVINCLPQGNTPQITHDLSSVQHSGDTIYAQAANSFCFDFIVSDSTGATKLITNPVSTIFGGNGGFPPPYATLTETGSNPKIGTICWNPPCSQVGKTFEVVITARDSADCPNYNTALDTIWIHILPPANSPPIVFHDLSANSSNGDTIIVDVKQNFCYKFFILDTTSSGSITYIDEIFSPTGDPLNNTHSITTTQSGDTLIGELCWKSFCNFGAIYQLVITGIDQNKCPPLNRAKDTVFIRIREPESFFPDVFHDLSTTNASNDTIFALAHEEFCFDFLVVDTSGNADSLRIKLAIGNTKTGIFEGLSPTHLGYLKDDTLFGNICWIPRCLNIGETYRLIANGIQINTCWIEREAPDTIYVTVGQAVSPPPQIGHTFTSTNVSNDTIYLEDNESFCFDFSLQDTATPSQLLLTTEIYLLNGTAYSGTLPTTSITTKFDSLLDGSLCWEVECEYANETFMLLLVGRDTFDCDLVNTVFDTVYVVHKDNVPAAVQNCRASVLPGDKSVSVKWEHFAESDLSYFILERRASDENGYMVVDTIYVLTDSVFQDQNSVHADDGSICYRVRAVDNCGNISSYSDPVCTIHLKGESIGFNSELNWIDVIGWDGNVANFEMHQSGITSGLSNFQMLNSMNGTSFEYVHVDVEDAINCYKIRAIENGNGCGYETWSNEVCMTFPPRIYFPNAFTPNGDGLNDRFEIPGIFLQSFHLMIYDRWGKLIFESHDPEFSWDGTLGNNGNAAPEGVYVFVMNGTGYEGTSLHNRGSLTLIR